MKQKWFSRLHTAAVLALVVMVTIGLYNEYRKSLLNQRYQEAVEQQEVINKELKEIIQKVQIELSN